jgi:mercuric ion transport protein
MNMPFKRTTATLPGLGVALLPKVVCPVCSPAYAAVLSAMGLPFFATARYLLPVTIAFVTLAVGSLCFGASRRRGLGPFWLGIVAAVSLISGKFWINSVLAIYAGVALLITASVWNATPKRRLCPACEAGACNERSS